MTTNEFKRATSDPAIPHEESCQPECDSPLRDFLMAFFAALIIGLPLTVVYLWRTGGL